MNKISRSSTWLVFLLMVFTSACASSAPPAKLNPTGQISIPSNTPGAVQIFNFESSPAPQTTPSPIPSHNSTPTQEPPLSPTPMTTSDIATEVPLASPMPTCTNQAEFVKHLSIGDFTQLKSGQYFAKVWQIKNIGTCIWTKEYALIFYDGNDMSGPLSIPLTQDVAPGEMIDLSVNLIAPNQVGVQTSNWMLQDNHGQLFGLGEASDQPLAVNIVIVPTPFPTPGCARCQADVDVSR